MIKMTNVIVAISTQHNKDSYIFFFMIKDLKMTRLKFKNLMYVLQYIIMPVRRMKSE